MKRVINVKWSGFGLLGSEIVGWSKKFFCWEIIALLLYKLRAYFGGVLRVAAGTCCKIMNLLEKPRKWAKNLQKKRCFFMPLFAGEVLYLHPILIKK